MTDAARARLLALVKSWHTQAGLHKTHGDTYRIGQGWGLEQAANELDSALLAAEGGDDREPGLLVIDARFGVKDFHIEGPMGLYPEGFTVIQRAVHDALGEHARQAAALTRALPPQVEP